MKDRNLDKIIFPKEGFTKRDVIEYYQRIAPVMLPHVQNRPLVLQRCPEGIDHDCHYQENVGDFPSSIDRVRVKKAGRHLNLAAVHNKEALASLDCVTLYMWLSRAPRVENPDLLIFDLDPSADSFRRVREMAIALRDLLALLGLKSFPMTTGSRGFDVCVPLDGASNFDTVRQFGFDVVHGLTDAYPEIVTMKQRKSSRSGSVFIDVTRNAYGETMVAPYSLRAKAGATVATPLDWSEVSDPRLHSQRYNLRNIFRRLESIQGDPWKSIWKNRQSLAPARKTFDSWIPRQDWRAVA